MAIIEGFSAGAGGEVRVRTGRGWNAPRRPATGARAAVDAAASAPVPRRDPPLLYATFESTINKHERSVPVK